MPFFGGSFPATVRSGCFEIHKVCLQHPLLHWQENLSPNPACRRYLFAQSLYTVSIVGRGLGPAVAHSLRILLKFPLRCSGNLFIM